MALTRLRACNQLLEIRQQDLRFTGSETAELLVNSTGYSVSEEAVANLQREIEGWAVGLRLVVLALRHNNNPDEFLKSLHGGGAQIQRYLMNEVLLDLSPEFRRTLVKISILNRFCFDLIEYVCAPDANLAVASELSAAEFIVQLQQGNLFVICIDPQQRWFRFHHLFQELLQRELSCNFSESEIAQAHLRASAWLESQGVIDEAIGYALKAGDMIFAAKIIEQHCYDEMEKDGWYVLQHWLSMIPESIRDKRLILLLAQTWIAMFAQQFGEITSLLADIEVLVKEEDCSQEQLGEVDFFRGYLLFWETEFTESIRLLERAQRRIDKHKGLFAAEIDLHLAICRYMSGQGKLALRELDRAIRETGSMQLARRLATLALIHMLSGDLYGLAAAARHMCALSKEMRSPLTDAWSLYLSGCVDLHQMRLEAAAGKFQQIVTQPYIIDRRAAIDAFAGLALTQQLLRQPDAATDTVGRLMAFVSSVNDYEHDIVAQSCAARICILQGRLQEAVEWEQACYMAPESFDLFLWLEAPPITRVRVLLALGSEKSLCNALQLLEEISIVSKACRLEIQLIEVAAIKAIVLAKKQGRVAAALQSLQQALTLAESGGWIRPFIELGPPMLHLLGLLLEKDDTREYIKRLIAFFPTPDIPLTESNGLTNRELDILALLALRLQNKEIAKRLFISPHTVKDHLKHIYRKLGVGSRSEAVSIAINIGAIRLP